ncbi:hypothetical protein IJI91_00035 [Candidatus Saccharibacteria bacterium]|nr:hypothetical protein [Candidatus Saccharibacteria bacterium]
MTLFSRKQENLNTEQGQSRDEHPLSKEKSFEEHMADITKNKSEKTFDEARRDGSLPEGVRDKKDYEEYLITKNAHETEAVNYDKWLVNEIDKLENANRNLVLAQLHYNYEINGNHTETPVVNPVELALEYTKQNKNLEEFFETKIRERDDELKKLSDLLKKEGADFSDKNKDKVNRLERERFSLEKVLFPKFIGCQYIEKVDEAMSDAILTDKIVDFCKEQRVSDSAAFNFKHFSPESNIEYDIPEMGDDDMITTENRPQFYEGVLKLITKDIIDKPISDTHFSELVQKDQLAMLGKEYAGEEPLEVQIDALLSKLFKTYSADSWLQSVDNDFKRERGDAYHEVGARVGDLIRLAAIKEVKDKVSQNTIIYKKNKQDIEQGEQILDALRQNTDQ